MLFRSTSSAHREKGESSRAKPYNAYSITKAERAHAHTIAYTRPYFIRRREAPPSACAHATSALHRRRRDADGWEIRSDYSFSSDTRELDTRPSPPCQIYASKLPSHVFTLVSYSSMQYPAALLYPVNPRHTQPSLHGSPNSEEAVGGYIMLRPIGVPLDETKS